MNDNPINYVTPRTKAGTIVEIVCAVLMLIIWIATAVAVAREDRIDSTALFGNAAFFTIIVALLLFLCYKPKTFNVPEVPTERHYHLTVWCVRVVSVEMSMLFLVIQLQEIRWMSRDVPEVIFGIVIMLTAAVFMVLMRRGKNK